MSTQDDQVFRRPTKISIQQFRFMRDQLLTLFDRREELASRLESDGFSAFRPRQEFEESFCSTPSELDLHRRHAIEHSKINFSGRLRSFLPFRDRETAMAELYVCPLIEELLKDAPHVDRSDLGHAWSMCEPCNWKREQFRLKHWDDHEQRFRAMMRAEGALFFAETEVHKSEIADRYGRFRLLNSRKLIRELAKHYGGRMGFGYDRKKSERNAIAIVKPVNADWELRWLIGGKYYAKPLLGPPRNDDREGYAWFSPEFYLCESRLSKQSLAEETEVMGIGYAALVPLGTAYGSFYDRYELETCVKAHFTLMGYVIDEMVETIRAALDQ